LILINTAAAFGQGSAGNTAPIESRFIVDMPTAGVLSKGSFAVNGLFFPGGGVMTEISAAPFTNFNMGVSFSGTNIIGSGEVLWQNLPGVSLRLRLLNEMDYLPAFLIGVSTQGRGIFYEDGKRFERLSPGLFLAFSKNYKYFAGSVAVHGGINYSFEPSPAQRAPNFYIGLEHSIGGPASLSIEFNPNIDDKNKDFYNQNGLLNISLRLSIISGLTIELQVRDLLEHNPEGNGFARFAGFEYVSKF
jgi:hypothetical protein